MTIKQIKSFAKNYVPGSMSFSGGFLGPRGNVGFEMRIDEKKAKDIVKELIAEGKKIHMAELGLDGDFQINSTIIYDGKFHKYDAHPQSIWAKPILIVHFSDHQNEAYECWKK